MSVSPREPRPPFELPGGRPPRPPRPPRPLKNTELSTEDLASSVKHSESDRPQVKIPSKSPPLIPSLNSTQFTRQMQRPTSSAPSGYPPLPTIKKHHSEMIEQVQQVLLRIALRPDDNGEINLAIGGESVKVRYSKTQMGKAIQAEFAVGSQKYLVHSFQAGAYHGPTIQDFRDRQSLLTETAQRYMARLKLPCTHGFSQGRVQQAGKSLQRCH